MNASLIVIIVWAVTILFMRKVWPPPSWDNGKGVLKIKFYYLFPLTVIVLLYALFEAIITDLSV